MDSKKWYQSSTIVAGYIATLCGIAQLFGIALGPEDQATITAAVVGIGTAIAGITAVVGRYNKNIKPIK